MLSRESGCDCGDGGGDLVERVKRAFLERADAMRDAARTKVDRFGLIQGVCGAPDFHAPGTAAEGQAFFLLMEAAPAELAEPGSRGYSGLNK